MPSNPRILVIDDDENIRTVFRMNLESRGYTVETASNGEEAIRKAGERPYQLALIDIKLPDIEGTELLKVLAKVAPTMKRMIVTGFPTLQNAIKAVNQGADMYVLKPVRMEDLFRKVEELLESHRDEAEYGEKKVEEYIEAKARELSMINKSKVM